MARINKGILGPVSGKVGPVVGANWNGIDYIRSIGVRKAGSSIAQLDQQLKFAAVCSFLQVFTSLLEITFKKYAVKMTGFNAAFSYNILEAVTGVSPDYTIDYAKALLSRGELPNVTAPGATATGNVVHYTWTNNSGAGTAAATDQAIFIAYCPAMSMGIYTIGNAERGDGAGTLDLASFAGQTVETWIAFITDDGKEAATSLYTGQLTL